VSRIACKIYWNDDPEKKIYIKVCEAGAPPELDLYDDGDDDEIFFYFDGEDPLQHDGEFTVVDYQNLLELEDNHG